MLSLENYSSIAAFVQPARLQIQLKSSKNTRETLEWNEFSWLSQTELQEKFNNLCDCIDVVWPNNLLLIPTHYKDFVEWIASNEEAVEWEELYLKRYWSDESILDQIKENRLLVLRCKELWGAYYYVDKEEYGLFSIYMTDNWSIIWNQEYDYVVGVYSLIELPIQSNDMSSLLENKTLNIDKAEVTTIFDLSLWTVLFNSAWEYRFAQTDDRDLILIYKPPKGAKSQERQWVILDDWVWKKLWQCKNHWIWNIEDNYWWIEYDEWKGTWTINPYKRDFNYLDHSMNFKDI